MPQKLRRRLGDMSTIKQLMEEAETIARRDGLTQPAAEHLVLAALDPSDGTARAALERAGSSAGAFTSAVPEQHAEVGLVVDDDLIDASLPDPGTPRGVYRSETSAQELFHIAGADARAADGGLLGAHVLRAAAGLEHGTIPRTLQHLGLDHHALRDAATAEIAEARTK